MGQGQNPALHVLPSPLPPSGLPKVGQCDSRTRHLLLGLQECQPPPTPPPKKTSPGGSSVQSPAPCSYLRGASAPLSVVGRGEESRACWEWGLV